MGMFSLAYYEYSILFFLSICHGNGSLSVFEPGDCHGFGFWAYILRVGDNLQMHFLIFCEMSTGCEIVSRTLCKVGIDCDKLFKNRMMDITAC